MYITLCKLQIYVELTCMFVMFQCETSNIQIENDISVSAIIDGKSDITEYV